MCWLIQIMKLIRKLRFLHRAYGYRLRQDRREISLLRKVLSPGDTAIDVGAHKGAYTWWMRQAVGSDGKVIAFEPQPELATYLRAVVRDFRLRNVEVVNSALSATPGKLKLFRPDGQVSPGATVQQDLFGAQGRPIDVEVESLDHYLRHHPTGPVKFIKCDVEGHELEVLRGCRRIMAEDRPVFLLECADFLRAGGLESVASYLDQYGYNGLFSQKGTLTSIQKLPAAQRDPNHPEFVNNFVFVHRQYSGQLRRAA